jgi:exodeoxyribonuclease V alpha subunit
VPETPAEKQPKNPDGSAAADLFSGAVQSGIGDGSAGMPEHRLHGEVLRVVYAADDGEYAVIRLRDEKKVEHTLTGPLASVVEGQDVEVWGRWETHKEHGRQFRVQTCRAMPPTSEAGIRRYLASGILHGIGKVYADRIVDKFGERTLEVLERYSARLNEVPGLGKKRLAMIREGWKKNAEAREVHVYLQGLGIGTAYCHRIHLQYGAGTTEVVRQNPYRLASEIRGIGFATADRIAGSLGVVKDNPLRLQAGVAFVLEQLAEQYGHVCCPREFLLESAAKMLDVEQPAAAEGLRLALLNATAVAETIGGDEMIYPAALYAAEVELAESLATLNQFKPWLPPEGALVFDPKLNAEQRRAVVQAFGAKISVITGGPGVGKTTVVGQIVANAKRLRRSLLLAAPTGRAAKRMTETCGVEAKTIHRLLQWNPDGGTFVHNRDNPLRGDIIIVDETSMLDTELANHLFRAIPSRMHVVLVGDRDQLPSVGPGMVLHDLIASRQFPVTSLVTVYRQDAHSRIVTNAHLINQGQMPDLKPLPPNIKGDFYWIEQEDPERAVQTIARMIAERIPATFKFNPLADVQVLAPMHKGSCGAQALNELLQKTLNGAPAPDFRVGERLYRVGDRVMQVSNNYDKGVFNGELGRISKVDAGAKTFAVAYDIGEVQYGWQEADQVRLAYAVTVHKSQGSEFPVVVVPLLSQHYVMLQRNLVYTAMTRARKLLVMIGSKKALAIAVRNDRPASRHTRLAVRLQA